MWLSLPVRDPCPPAAPSAAARRAQQGGLLRSLLRRRRGATAMEFAAVAPAFITILLLIMETAWQLTVDSALTIGLFLGARYGITGAGYAAGTRDATILSTIISSSGGVLQQANLTLSSQAYPNPAVYAAGGAAATGSGSSGQLVVYTATYNQPFLTIFPGAVLRSYGNTSNSISHTAKMVVQNEPF